MSVLERSWARCWSRIGAEGTGEALRDDLRARYGEPHRRYHTVVHLEECLGAFAAAEARGVAADDPGAVEVALWFHDAVHDPKAGDDEARSAALARDRLGAAAVAEARVERVAALVLATRHSAVPRPGDEALVVDVDLAILGADPARFDEYDGQVREEYAWVPGPIYRRERRRVLQGFLARPSIYTTEDFRRRLEEPARGNLARAIARL